MHLPRRDAWAPLPHEIAWAALFTIVIVWLALSRAWLELLPWGAMVGVTAMAIAVHRTRPGPWSERARLGVFLLTMNAAYFRMGAVVAAASVPTRDALLQALDVRLFGGVLPVLVDGWKHPVATELLSAAYFLLYPCILLRCSRWLRADAIADGTARAFYAGLFTLYAVGFLGYLLVPARGAWLDLPGAFGVPVAGGWMTALNDAVVRAGTNRVDVFPSLHVAASAFMLRFDFAHDRPAARRWLVPVVALWVSTVYLRYHYGVDVIAGFALAFFAWRIARSTRPVPPFRLTTSS